MREWKSWIEASPSGSVIEMTQMDREAAGVVAGATVTELLADGRRRRSGERSRRCQVENPSKTAVIRARSRRSWPRGRIKPAWNGPPRKAVVTVPLRGTHRRGRRPCQRRHYHAAGPLRASRAPPPPAAACPRRRRPRARPASRRRRPPRCLRARRPRPRPPPHGPPLGQGRPQEGRQAHARRREARRAPAQFPLRLRR